MGYNRQFRDEIIRLHIEEGWSTRSLANEYGIGRTTIQSWLRSHRDHTGTTPQQAMRPKTLKAPSVMHQKLLTEVNTQIDILNSFRKELGRWAAKKQRK